ncbi:MAG: capsid cement protein [bacterium]
MQVKPILPITEQDIIVETVVNTDTSAIASGSVVITDTATLTKRAVKLTTTADSSLVRGIALEDIPVGAERKIARSGIVSAKVQTGATAVAIGDKLGTSANSGKLGLVTNNPVAIALQDVAANTDTTIKVDVKSL